MKVKTIIKWVLAAFIGSVASLLLIIISEGIHQLLTCGIVAFLVGAFLYYAVLERSEFRLIGTIASGIVAFILYFILYSYINENTNSYFVAFLVFFIPYVIIAYIMFGIPNGEADQDKNSN